MRRILVVLAILATGCVSAPPVVNVQPPDSATTAGISVNGTGKVEGTPDTLTLTLGVSLSRGSVSEATVAAADLAAGIIDALEANGVIKEDIATSNYSVNPEYDYRNDRQRIIGYRVTNTVRVKIRNIDRAGAIIDAAVAAGGDETVVNGVTFNIEENSALVVAAREQAWNDAKSKASQLASLAGLELGPATSITETFSATPGPYPMYRADAAAGAATPIEPGQQTVTVTISVVFSLG